MKKLWLGSLALLALGSVPATAADMAVAPRAVVPVTTWTGCRIGGDLGTNWGKADYTTTSNSHFFNETNRRNAGTVPPPPPGTDVGGGSFNLTGFIGGFRGGCDYQFAAYGYGSWVIGIEGDFSATNKSGQTSEAAIGHPGWIVNQQERWLTTARARLGYAWDKWLVYVTGGGAWAKIDSHEENDGAPSGMLGAVTGGPTTQANLATDRRGGWTAGAGMEYMLPYGWSIRTQFLYVKFREYTTLGSPTCNFGCAVLTPLNAKSNDYILTSGLSYKFY
jgi:outer membrane immunogenic protein